MAFDKFMVVNEIASNAKVARLTDAEFRCLLQGVWPMASKSSPRGYLLVGSLPAEARDIANQARCTVAVASRTLDKLRLMGMVALDESAGWEFCHDWDEINPAPRKDSTNAERQARFREKRKAASLSAVYERAGNQCINCGGTEHLSIDHIVPRSKGGSDDETNLQILCRECNSSKQDRDAPSPWIGPALRRERNARGNAGNGALSPDNAREVEEEVEEEERQQHPGRGMGRDAGANVGLDDLDDSEVRF